MFYFDICRFGHVYNTLQPRLTETLLNAPLDPKKALTQHYGAIQGLAAQGPNVVISFSCFMQNQILMLHDNFLKYSVIVMSKKRR